MIKEVMDQIYRNTDRSKPSVIDCSVDVAKTILKDDKDLLEKLPKAGWVKLTAFKGDVQIEPLNI